jgi:NAD(P)H-dependent FMN reductase
MREPKILVFAGSVRSDSWNRKVAMAARNALAAAGADVTLADLRDYPMPMYDGDVEAEQGLPSPAKAFKELVRRHDVLVIASPEYNGSFPALLKNAIDWASRPEPGEPHLAVFRGKTAALLSASPGQGGGKRGLRHLRELLEMIGMNVVGPLISIPRVSAAFDGTGNLARAEDQAALDGLVAELTGATANTAA